MSLNSKQKPLCQLATTELFPNETGKQPKNDKSVFGSNALEQWFLVFIQPREALFLSLMVTNCSGGRPFSKFKSIKNELKGRNVPGEVVHAKHSVH